MFPHKLSSRPIVIRGDSHIKIIITPNTESAPKVSCDGQERIAIKPTGIIEICKKAKPLRLLHPNCYYYFETLRNKLGWEESKI
jgi:NAD+ kinase